MDNKSLEHLVELSELLNVADGELKIIVSVDGDDIIVCVLRDSKQAAVVKLTSEFRIVMEGIVQEGDLVFSLEKDDLVTASNTTFGLGVENFLMVVRDKATPIEKRSKIVNIEDGALGHIKEHMLGTKLDISKRLRFKAVKGTINQYMVIPEDVAEMPAGYGADQAYSQKEVKKLHGKIVD